MVLSSKFLKLRMRKAMVKLVTKLRLHSKHGSSNNIWLTFFLTIMLVGLNYRALIMPLWVIAVISIGLVLLSVISLASYVYRIFRYWRGFSTGRKFYELFIFNVLLVFVVLIVYTLLKINSYPGG